MSDNNALNPLRHSLTARSQKYINVLAEFGSREYAAQKAGLAGPPPHTEKIKRAVAARRQQVMADEILELSIAAIRDALSPDNPDRRLRTSTGITMWKDSREEFAGAVDADEEDPAEMSPARLQSRIEALRAREMTLLHAAAEKAVDVTPTVDNIEQSDPFACRVPTVAHVKQAKSLIRHAYA
jgi:hypothetical protein